MTLELSDRTHLTLWGTHKWVKTVHNVCGQVCTFVLTIANNQVSLSAVADHNQLLDVDHICDNLSALLVIQRKWDWPTLEIHLLSQLQPIPLRVIFSKAQSSKLKRLFCHVSVKRDVRALSCELWNSIRKCHPKWDWLYLDVFQKCHCENWGHPRFSRWRNFHDLYQSSSIVIQVWSTRSRNLRVWSLSTRDLSWLITPWLHSST